VASSLGVSTSSTRCESAERFRVDAYRACRQQEASLSAATPRNRRADWSSSLYVVVPANCDTHGLRRLRAPAQCPRSGLVSRDVGQAARQSARAVRRTTDRAQDAEFETLAARVAAEHDYPRALPARWRTKLCRSPPSNEAQRPAAGGRARRSRMSTSTRRFSLRPSGLSDPSGWMFGATGLASPKPRALIGGAYLPSTRRNAPATVHARRHERARLNRAGLSRQCGHRPRSGAPNDDDGSDERFAPVGRGSGRSDANCRTRTERRPAR
jgi:hypothetical protein